MNAAKPFDAGELERERRIARIKELCKPPELAAAAGRLQAAKGMSMAHAALKAARDAEAAAAKAPDAYVLHRDGYVPGRALAEATAKVKKAERAVEEAREVHRKAQARERTEFAAAMRGRMSEVEPEIAAAATHLHEAMMPLTELFLWCIQNPHLPLPKIVGRIGPASKMAAELMAIVKEATR